MSDSEFKDIVTVLINLCVHVDLDMSSESMQVVASNISNHQREMVCLWLIANIICTCRVTQTKSRNSR